MMLIAMTVVFLSSAAGDAAGSGRCSFRESSSFIVVPARSARCATRSFRRAGSSQSSRARPNEDPNLAGAGSVSSARCSVSRGLPDLRRRARDEDHGLWSQHVPQRADPRQPVAEHDPRARLRRCAFGSALRSQRQAPLPCVTGIGDGDDWLSPDLPLRSRASASDAVRRVQVHAGHIRLLDPARALRGDAEDQRGDAGGGAGVGAATVAENV